MKRELPLIVYSNENKPSDSCKAVEIVKTLHDSKKFYYDFNAIGNCYEIALRLLDAVSNNGYSTSGWLFVTGTCALPLGHHAWLEFDGWAVDFSSGQSMFAPVEDFINVYKPEGVKKFTFEEVKLKQLTKKGREELGIYTF